MARMDPLWAGGIEPAVVRALDGSVLRMSAKTILPLAFAAFNDEMTTTTDPLPAVYVFYAYSEIQGLTSFEEEESFYFSFLCVDASLSGDRNTVARLGNQYTVGTYTLLETLRKVLVMNQCGIDNLTPFRRFGRIEALPTTAALSMYIATYVSEGNIVPAVNRNYP